MRQIGGYVSLYLSATVFAFVALLVQFASAYHAPVFISAFRFLIGASVSACVLAFGYKSMKPKKIGLLAMRGLFGSLSMAAAYAAFALSGPGRATLLGNTYPLFVALFGAAFFGEKLNARTLAGLALCLAGAVLVARDGSGASLFGDLLAMLSSVAAGFAVNYVRKVAPHENPFMIYLSPCLFGLPIFFFVPSGSSAFSGGLAGFALLLAVGVGALGAQALMAHGYKTVSAGAGSVVFYWETILCVVLGVLFAGERINARFIAGLAVILVGLRVNQGFARKGACAENAGQEPREPLPK